MRKLMLNFLLLVTFLLGSTLVVPATENDFVKGIKASAYHNGGVDLYRAGRYNKALYCLDKALEIYPNFSPVTYEFRAKVYFKLKQYNKAWHDVKKAQSLKEYVYVGKKQQSRVYKVDPVFLEELRQASGREK